MKYTAVRRLVIVTTIFQFLCFGAFGQVTTGTPPFRSFSGGPDIINLGNLNVHYSIPIFSRPGRGIPFNYSLAYDSSVWKIAGTAWTPASSTWGLNRELSARVGTMIVTATQVPGCNGTGATLYAFSSYVDSTGTAHKLIAVVEDDPDCNLFTKTKILDDGSGITVTVDATPSATVTLKSGEVIKPILSSGTNSGSGTSTDENGNQITSVVNGSTTTFYDTLSTTTRALTISGTAPSNVTYKYTSPSGADAITTAAYQAYTVKTKFQCSGISEYGPLSNSLIDHISLPDGSKYVFTYEQTPASASCTPLGGTFPSYCTTGRLASVTLPTGGTISYSYTGPGTTGTSGIICSDGSTAGFTRTTPDTTGGTQWKYLRATSATSTTVTDPQGNDTVVTFNGEFETARDAYLGSSTAGTVLEHVTTCYNGTSASPCTGTFVTPFTQVTVERQYDGGLPSRVDAQYDGYGSAKELDEFDFGASSPTRQTTTQFATLGNNIVDRPSSVIVKDGAGTQKARTDYAYDEYGLQGTGTLPNHIGVSGARGNLTTIKRYSSATAYLSQTLNYYDTGLVYTSTDVNSAVTTFTYGNCNGAFPSSISLPLTLSRSMIWNCNGGVATSSTDPNSKATTFTYDEAFYWRPHKIDYPDGGETAYTYHTGISNPWSIDTTSRIDGTHNMTGTTTLDGLGRISKTQLTSAPEGTITTDTLYDVNGRLASRSNAHLSAGSPTDGITSYTYDPLGRVTKVTNPDSSNVLTTYSEGATQVQDEGNGSSRVTKVYQSDGLGRLASVCEVTSGTLLGISSVPGACGQDIGATGFLTSYTYDTLDNLSQVTQGGLNPRQYSYDQLSRMTSAVTPESGTTTYTYDHTGQLGDLYTRVKPTANQSSASVKTTTTYNYDQLHRPKTITYDDGTSNATFGYDESLVGTVTVVNGKGRLTHMSGRDSTEVYSYDAMGRRNGGTQCTPVSCGGTWWSLAYAYNLLGEMTSYTNGYESRTYSYTYDNAARLTKMTSSLSDTTHPGTLLTVNTYNPLGEITQETLGNSIVRTLGYDNLGRITSLNDGSLYDFSIGFAPNSGVLTANDSLNGNWTYTYDDFNRISTSTKTGNAFNYKYDRFGNRWQQNVTTGSGPHPSYVLDASNHVSIFTYDAAGNVENDTFHMYTYDAEGRVLTVDTSAATYQYDPLGRRIRRTVGSAIHNYMVDPQGHIISDAGPSATSSELYAGSMHVATYANSNTYFDHSDWLGTARMRTDASGTSVETCTGLAYGDSQMCAGTDWSPLHFTGADWDSETSASNLYRFLFRQYSSTQGRWITPDPGNLGVSSAENPQSWNRYAYVLSNPLGHKDDLGLGCILYLGRDKNGQPIFGFGPCQNNSGLPEPGEGFLPYLYFYESDHPAPPRSPCDGPCPKKPTASVSAFQPQPKLKEGCTGPALLAGVKAAVGDFFTPPGADVIGDVGDAIRDENVQRATVGTAYVVANASRALAPALDVAADAIPVVGEVILAYQVGSALYEGGKAYKEAVDQCYDKP